MSELTPDQRERLLAQLEDICRRLDRIVSTLDVLLRVKSDSYGKQAKATRRRTPGTRR